MKPFTLQKVKFKMFTALEMFTTLNVDYEGKSLAKITSRRVRQSAFLFLILAYTLTTLSLLPFVRATMAISSITPSSGNVGTQVQMAANLTTTGGRYEVRFDSDVVATGNATENSVSTSFTVPETIAGNHTVKIVDLATGENATSDFNVTTAYSMDVRLPESPLQLQENDSISISLNITGGDASKIYAANITVQTPTGTSFAKTLDVVTSTLGSEIAFTRYPDDFPTGANTNFVGDYTVTFNDTLGTKTFSVGLTNSTEYHRTQTVNIKAVYKPDENVTVTTTGKDIHDSANLTDHIGLITYNWTVPMNASMGTYNVNIVSISSSPTTKSPPDSQDFTVPGYAVNVTARNLAGDSVSAVEIRAFENGTSVTNVTTASTGMAILNLELGYYMCQAYSKNQNVGNLEIAVNGTASADLTCNLTNLRIHTIAIVNEIEMAVPEVEIYLTPEDTIFSTNTSGTVVAYSLLPNSSYTLNASRYTTQFNVTTIPQLLVNENPVAWFNVTIICPALRLRVTALKAGGQPLDAAIVKIQELLGGLHYEGNVDANGLVSFNPVFGKYTVRVYDRNTGLELNETTVDLLQDSNITIYCSLYGLVVSVKVVDYFGQPLSNVNVTLQRQSLQPLSSKTQSDGQATFTNLIGGSFQIALYLSDQTEPTIVQAVDVENSTTTVIKIEKYVSLAGFLIETSQFLITMVIAATLVLVVLLEVYRRRQAKTKKSES
jgi:hypothetical protein